MKKIRIYTKGGDKGKTSLVGGQRVAKDDPRLESYGTVDELNSFVGLLRAQELDKVDDDFLFWVQHKLFTLGGYLATNTDEDELVEATMIKESYVDRIEKEIDRLDEILPAMTAFILPAGGEAASLAHVARTVCRRAERRICSLSEIQEIDPNVSRFVNRLSDYFFVLARFLALKNNPGGEVIWQQYDN